MGEECATIALKVSSGSKKTEIKFTRWQRDHLLRISTLGRRATEKEELANVNSPLRRDRELLLSSPLHMQMSTRDGPRRTSRLLNGELCGVSDFVCDCGGRCSFPLPLVCLARRSKAERKRDRRRRTGGTNCGGGRER